MSKAYEFLKECGSFFVLTLNGDYPAGRPFYFGLAFAFLVVSRTWISDRIASLNGITNI